MIFTGYFKDGVFKPSYQIKSYKAVTQVFEEKNMCVCITISEPTKRSEKQLSLFNVLLSKTKDLTQSSEEEIIDSLEDIRYKRLDKSGKLVLVPLEDLDTRQFSNFIEVAIIKLNKVFDLNISVEMIKGITQVTNE